jgi:DNA-binding NarL/FixJ family response regulator
MIRIALMDDHPLILRIVRQELASEADLQVIWDTSDASQLFTLISQDVPEVLVLDLAFSGQDFEPVSAVRDLRTRFPRMSILILTAHDDSVWIEELLQAGVQGYVLKSDDFSLRLAQAVRTVAQGKTFLSAIAISQLTHARQRYTLTSQERAILRLAAQGKSNPEIAQTLAIANGTVRNHLSNIYTKLDVQNREAAVRSAQNLRELPKPGATARHELRTPLHTLMGLARILQTRLERVGQLTEHDADFLQQIILEAERLDSLINDYT